MSCPRGRLIHAEFEQAVHARIAAEQRFGPRSSPEIRAAQKIENDALLKRTMHVSGCRECWMNPPQ